jgi:hypothetical protein
LGVPFAYLAYFAVESLCLVPKATLGPLCPAGKIRAKQSQFRRLAYPTILLFYHSTILRQTNPICGRAERGISAVWIRSCDEWDTGEAVKKQSQSSHCGFRISDCGLGDRPAVSGLRRAFCAKQTQFSGHGRDAHATERLAASPRRRGDDIAANKASAPNKPNFGTTQTKDNCGWRKEL